MTSPNDVVGLQRAVVAVVTDDDARSAWMSDPHGFATSRLSGAAAEALARIDPSGVKAMTMSHVTKKARFDRLHRLHHELEARRAEAAVGGHEHAQTDEHPHTSGHPHTHERPHTNGHGEHS